MNLLPPIQMGEEHDFGTRDEQGREHGHWIWVEPIKYALGLGEFFETSTRMTVEYNHGQVIKAFLEYDISKKHTASWEEGRAIGDPLIIIGQGIRGLPFKKGLWRGVGKSGWRTVSMYDGVSILWSYRHDGFKYGIWDKKSGGFTGWNWTKTEKVRPPPPDDEWPLEWDPFIKDGSTEEQWVPPSVRSQTSP